MAEYKKPWILTKQNLCCVTCLLFTLNKFEPTLSARTLYGLHQAVFVLIYLFCKYLKEFKLIYAYEIKSTYVDMWWHGF